MMPEVKDDDNKTLTQVVEAVRNIVDDDINVIYVCGTANELQYAARMARKYSAPDKIYTGDHLTFKYKKRLLIFALSQGNPYMWSHYACRIVIDHAALRPAVLPHADWEAIQHHLDKTYPTDRDQEGEKE